MEFSQSARELVRAGRISDPAGPRGRLLREAAILFREVGYERTTVRMLADKVGIQSGSIFHHFRSKEEILEAVMEETVILNTAIQDKAVAAAGSPAARLRALILCELRAINKETGDAMSVLHYEWRCLSRPRQQKILRLRDRYESNWMDALGAMVEAGLVREDIFVLRRLLTGAIGWTVNWFRPDGPLSLEDLADRILGLTLRRDPALPSSL